MSHDALEAAADLALVERLRQQLVALDELAQQALRATRPPTPPGSV